MFRKIILRPIAYIITKPYFDRLRATEHRFKDAVKIYNDGDKNTALLKFRELVSENGSDKASRYWMGRISVEIREEEKLKNNISTNKPK